MNTPFVMVYRVSPLTYALGRSHVKVPYFAMVNLIAGEKFVPELVQDNFGATNVVDHLQPLLPDGPPRAAMLEGLARVRSLLHGPEGAPAAPDRAAAIIQSMLATKPS